MMNNTTTHRPLANPRAEALFVASGLEDKYRPVINADARYMMNHVNCRFSDAVGSAIQSLKAGHAPASPMAASILASLD